MRNDIRKVRIFGICEMFPVKTSPNLGSNILYTPDKVLSGCYFIFTLINIRPIELLTSQRLKKLNIKLQLSVADISRKAA